MLFNKHSFPILLAVASSSVGTSSAAETPSLRNSAARHLSAPDPSCATDAKCYLYSLETETTTLLHPLTNIYDLASENNGLSIKCDASGGDTHYVKYSIGEGDDIKTQYDAPWWMNGDNSQTRINEESYLEECGLKHVDVTFFTWRGGDENPCFTKSFDLMAECSKIDTTAPIPTMEPGDFNIRFSKVKSLSTGIPIDSLKDNDYPMQHSMASKLSSETNAVSVVLTDDFELHGRDVSSYMEKVGGSPTYPNSDPDHPFWEDFRVVVEAQVHRLADGDPSDHMTLPDIWAGMDIHQVAEAVHDEYPGYWQSLLLQTFFGNAPVDYEICPFRSTIDFVGGPIRMATINTWAMAQVGPVNFCAKWFQGRPRPEEVAYQIKTGEIPASAVPSDIKAQIDQWDLSAATEFTAYPEGSPPHPSWPAMHSAASSASFWMSVVFNLTDEQYCQALLTDYMVSYARTVAGVHYPTDNIDGLNLGQEILADQIVSYLVDTYGANRQATQAKVDAKRFKWEDFDPVTCKIG